MTDILTRLRAAEAAGHLYSAAAADEIERLRAECDRLAHHNQQLTERVRRQAAIIERAEACRRVREGGEG